MEGERGRGGGGSGKGITLGVRGERNSAENRRQRWLKGQRGKDGNKNRKISIKLVFPL